MTEAVDIPAGAERRRRNLETLHRYYRLLGDLDIPAWTELWAEDCVQVMPYAAAGLPGRVSGREAVRELYQAMADGYRELAFDDLELLPLDDPDAVLARWKPRAVRTDGRSYRNQNIALFEFDPAGRIRRFTEYFDPTRFADDLDLAADG